MHTNMLPSEGIAVLGAISPQGLGGNVSTATWFDASNFHQLAAIVSIGNNDHTSVVAKLTQAQDAAGAGSKDIPNKATTALNATTGDNKQLIINVRPDELDANASPPFRYVGLTITNSGGTVASLMSAAIIGVNPRTGAAAQAASVAQAVP